jgi:tetratricopeptide (TPR) repeat protein
VPRRFFWPGVAVFAAALIVRLVHLWQIRDTPFFTVLLGDARAYDAWAQQIASGDWLGRDVFYQAPLYPYFLGTLYTVAGRDLSIVRICQAFIGALSCVLLGHAACRLFSRPAGIVAGLMLAFYAPAIFFDSLLQKAFLDVFLICLVIWMLSAVMTAPLSGGGHWFGLGAALGALALTRENALVLAAVVVGWILTKADVSWSQRRRQAALAVVGLVIVLAPVAARNWVISREFHLTTAQFGPNFYIGNNPDATGAYDALSEGRGSALYERQDATRIAERAAGRRLSPSEVSDYWFDRAMAFIRSDPAAWAQLLARKARLLLNVTEMMDTESQQSYAAWSTPLRLTGTLAHFGVLVPLVMFGLWVTWPRRRELLLLYLMGTAYAASVVLFYVFARYRYPLVPFLLLFAAAGLAGAAGFVRKASGAQLAGAMGTSLALAVFVNQPVVEANVMQAITESNLGEALQQEDRFDEAVEHYQRAIALRADWAPGYNNAGTARQQQGRVDEAVAYFEKALSLQPGYPRANYNMAIARLAQGRPADAIAHFRRALPSMADSFEAHRDMGIALSAVGGHAEAAEMFREALRLDPTSGVVHRNLGQALVVLGRQEEALEYFDRAIALDATDVTARLDLSTAFLDLGRLADAAAASREVLRLKPDSIEGHNNLAVALASQGQLDEAIEHFRAALTLQPEFTEARDNLARALKLRGATRRP